ncbi:MAG: hypothetical protein A2469_02270 [Candidatus Magasanikbacteria bacterium RIFOXYC2_FULL_40_16]|uniref:HTH arsR-type domain-containing protein n=3 Tax=Candidatus Magasanikiibacteriota TaxID=1752731 RepID=A0A1F6NJK4_9BACT|nr:MAG: hypothetical protein A2224_01245 [Candidatus Magasanikbacteria bacterium RIFOXYA2_FULL_40_20]OGH84028.1 MAG: hypothetical protein A2373_00520 [Candidatus Magasanikbacteria bacterium RIFOXYB1_FULL_40_15]OGH86884.1 MAG: hypothetical protein A2301_00700 [Candidatus Magasanikbacteria bacterium RIFOXYB2_FULL_40_13]OGH87686.1 MAG: hypothetical protein A2206_01985 [Candidatus Magasanikbacteria bacterium RIFOXYA1_FULL_40_8]OGH89232.1 MAG: hypothetical protein A2469_02270 [Candidatus Magasanikba
MLEHIFGSKTRLKLLKIFFKKQDTPFYVRELTRLLDVQINAIRRELELLIKSTLIKEIENKSTEKESSAKLRKYYVLNKESILYSEMHALLVREQALGEEKFTDELSDSAGDVKLLALSGQFTRAKSAPTDLLIVGNIKERSVNRMIDKYEKEFGFEIRYTILSEKEFADRRHVMDKFLFSIFEAPHVKVINKLGV